MAVAPNIFFPALPKACGGLRLRAFRSADGPAVLAAAEDPLMTHWLALTDKLATAGAVERWIEDGNLLAESGAGVRLAVTDAASGMLRGCVELCLSEHGGNVGYWTVPAARGRGVATSAVRLLCRWAFDHRLVTTLTIRTLPGNLASERVAEGAGFSADGTLCCYDPRRGGAVTFNVFTRRGRSAASENLR